MKRSRIICSIITVIYVAVLIAIAVCLVKNNLLVKSNINSYIKVIYVVFFAACMFMYVWLKKKLNNKVKSTKIIYAYRYMYLAVLILISRIVIAYILKQNEVENIIPCNKIGLGSYITYGISKLVKSTFYANLIVNSSITFGAVILIKRIMFNITKSDFLSGMASTMYILLPQSMYYIGEYNRYNYNLIVVLLGILLLMKLIDQVKQYKLKTNKYIYMAGILGLVAGLDIILGGSYLFWIVTLICIIPAARNIDICHISFGDKIKQKVSFKLRRILCKIEQINISKLVNTAIIAISISGIIKLLVVLITASSNYIAYTSMNEIYNKITQVMMHSRNYYLLIILLVILFDIVGIILKRRTDIKIITMKIINALFAVQMVLSADLTYTATLFDTSLVLLLIANICNIYYNREEKIKLLKEKN